jgi:hypothetical protein
VIKVPLDRFANFVLKVGIGKLEEVREFKEERGYDFYRPLREAIADVHAQKRSLGSLDAFLDELADDRKRRTFPELVEGYRRYLADKSKRPLVPPLIAWPIGDIEVDVAPELAYDTADGKAHLVKLRFHGEPLSPQRVKLTVGLMQLAFGSTRPGAVCSILDVKRAKVHSVASTNPRLAILLRGEAAAFATIYAGV